MSIGICEDVVIINSKIQGNVGLVRELSKYFQNIRFNTNNPSDILFPTVSPSLAINLVQHFDITSAVEHLSLLQLRFKNAFCILIDFDRTQRSFLQRSIHGGALRILECGGTNNEIAQIVAKCYWEMKEKLNFRRQTLFFQQLQIQMQTPAIASEIILQVLIESGIPLNDAQLVIEGFPRGISIILATEKDLDSCPVDINSVQLVSDLFRNNNFQLTEAGNDIRSNS